MSFFFEDPFYDIRRQAVLMDRLLRGFPYDTEMEQLSLPEPESEHPQSKGDKKEKALKPRDSDNAVFSWRPRSDIKETENSIIVSAELPGVPKENINIKIENDMLTIEGKKETSVESSSDDKAAKETKDSEKEHDTKEPKPEPKKVQWHRVERSFGSFRRSYALPAGTKPEDIKAQYVDGLLTIDIAKKQKEEKTINIPVM
eukprot:TRINITY_DN9566_c0_g1_i4.p1 TRINITY_DN9566_c0_g1~~TRINITY_DN9566_c0_g1_i4.p1  ORF type:complete len:201 (+),score=74.27 TRINITY_DN9566_c0_g1_i4:152-754(+)